MRLRIVFAKTEPMRYTSHLDLHRAWERTMRRAGLPLAYSEGFHPQPRINLASALPLGFTGEEELVDIWIEKPLEMHEIYDRLSAAVPPGIELVSVNEIGDHTPTLQSTLISSVYHVTLLERVDDLLARVSIVKNATSLERVRRGKKYDLRPLIEEVAVLEDRPEDQQVMIMQLSARDGATGRPDEVIDACSIDLTSVQIHRVKLLFNRNPMPDLLEN